MSMRWLRTAAVTSTCACIALACADEGAQGDVLEGALDGGDAGVEPPEVESGPPDAEPRLPSKLCRTSTPIDDDPSLVLLSIWGSSATDVWAVGTYSTILHYDGATWDIATRTGPSGSPLYPMKSVWLERADDVWIVDGPRVRHTTGWKGPTATEWTYHEYAPQPAGEPGPTAVRGRGTDVWLTRGSGSAHNEGARLVRFDRWTESGPGMAQSFFDDPRAPPISLTTIAVSRADEVWVSGDCSGTVCVFRASREGTGDESTWQVEEHDAKSGHYLSAAWGDDSVLWFAGEVGSLRRMERRNVPTRELEIVPSPVFADLYGIFGFGANDVWAVGEKSTVLHWDGASWVQVSTPFDAAPANERPRLYSVWGSSPSDVWIAGAGTVLHFQGGAP